MTKRLSEQESYFSMSEFLDSYYWASKDDDLGSLLGSVTLWSDDGELFDQAIAEDWHAFFSDVSNENHTVFESFQAVKQFVNEYLPDIAATTPVSGSLTYNIRIICEMTESQRNQEPCGKIGSQLLIGLRILMLCQSMNRPFLKRGNHCLIQRKRVFGKINFQLPRFCQRHDQKFRWGPVWKRWT